MKQEMINIHIVKDDTIDKSLAQEDRTIKYKIYEKIGAWNYQNSQYWEFYSGEITNENTAENLINSGNLFIIASDIIDSFKKIPLLFI